MVSAFFGRPSKENIIRSRLDQIKDWPALAKLAGYNATALAFNCRVSPRQLERFFQIKMGKSPHKLLRHLRMGRAVELISKQIALKEVAVELCYKDPAHFARDFKEFFGVTPSFYHLHPPPIPPVGNHVAF